MDIYKDYIQQLRRISFNEVYVLIGEDITPTLKHFIYSLIKVKFEANSYFSLYGEIKKVISSFLIFYSKSTDDILKVADKCTYVVDKQELMKLIEETISSHHSNQITFGKEFLPVKNSEEKRVYEEIESEFNGFMERVYEFKERIKKFDKKVLVDEFVAVHFERAVIVRSKALTFTNTFIAMLLADRLDEIRISIEEISLRMTNNLKHLQNECETSLNSLLQMLYDKNKDCLLQARRERKNSVQTAEVMKSIAIVHRKIEEYESENSLRTLETEVEFWQEKVREFHQIRDNLLKLKAEQDEIIKQEKIYNSLECFDPPGTKKQRWLNMGLNYAERKEKIKEMIVREALSLITFFAVKGSDHILYKNKKSHVKYYVDEYKHQIYVSNYALTQLHVDCQGDLIDVEEKPYYFDKNGRYIIENGERLYQSAPCTSKYRLSEDTTLQKVSEDCGHTETDMKECHMEIKDPALVEMLPDFLPMDIRKSLDSDTVKYLWDSFGSLLPDALYDVCMKKPRNPIHMLAHRLLYHKYSRTTKQLADKKKEAEQYRLDIYKKRHEKAVAASVAWKSKQTKRRKPEESDDALETAVFNAQQAEREFINYLNYYNYEL